MISQVLLFPLNKWKRRRKILKCLLTIYIISLSLENMWNKTYTCTYIINTLTGRKVRLWQAILSFFAASAKNADTHMMCVSCNTKSPEQLPNITAKSKNKHCSGHFEGCLLSRPCLYCYSNLQDVYCHIHAYIVTVTYRMSTVTSMPTLLQ